ncbi:non-ribosomal peptide synthetase, partial [Pedobacter cryoconitis]
SELSELYTAFIAKRNPLLSPLAVQYADYAIWQRSFMGGELLAKQQAYWVRQLSGLEPLNLPLDYPRPAVQSKRGAVTEMMLDPKLASQLNSLSRQQGVTLFMTLFSAFQVLLYRYSGQEDICVGTPVAGRRRREIEELIGFFVNTLAIRSDLSDTPAFTTLLQQVKNTLLESYDQQDIPFERVVDAVIKERDMSRGPLFQVMFVLQNTPDASKLSLGDTKFSIAEAGHTTALFDLTFTLHEGSTGLLLSVEYCTDLFTEGTVLRMMTHYEQLLHSIVADPSAEIGSLPMLLEAEETILLDVFSGTSADYPRDKTMLDLFMEQVARVPEAIAVSYQGEDLSYRELDKRSSQLGYYLRSKGVKEETLVPICINRSLDMIVGILGILKAGGAYVPVDPAYPQDRIRYTLEDTGAFILVSHSDCSEVCQSGTIEVIELDRDAAAIANAQSVSIVARSAHQAAYVIYTSGSTGRPKGVLIEDSNVVRLFETDQPLYDFNETDVWTMFHSFCFDFSVWEMYGALFYGGRLVIVPRAATQDSTLFGQLLLDEKVTVLNQTPSSFYVLQDYLTSHAAHVDIRYVIFGGEALNPEKTKPWKDLYQSCRL